MHRFNKLRIGLIERKDQLESAICQASDDEDYSEARNLIAKYEEITEILNQMCRIKEDLSISSVSKPIKLRLVR